MSCIVCNAKAKSSCPYCQTPFCSEDCQRAGWSDHKERCLTILFGKCGHYAFFLDQMLLAITPPQDVRKGMKSTEDQLKTLNIGVLGALNKLRDGGKVPNKIQRSMWEHFNKLIGIIPKEMCPNEPNIDACYKMLQTVRDFEAKEETPPPLINNDGAIHFQVPEVLSSQHPKGQCSHHDCPNYEEPKKCCVCYEPFCTDCCPNEPCLNANAQLPCPCVEDMCNRCFCPHVIRSAEYCGCGCKKWSIKCPICREVCVLRPDFYEWCKNTVDMHGLLE